MKEPQSMRLSRRILMHTAIICGSMLIAGSALMAEDIKALKQALAKVDDVKDLKKILANGKNFTDAEKELIREKRQALQGKANKVPARVEPVPPIAQVKPDPKNHMGFEKRIVVDSTKIVQSIDSRIDAKLAEKSIDKSPIASDAEFMRRVYLDINGMIPTAEEAAAFLDSKDPLKRSKLIDELLASDKYGRHQADIWQSLLVERTSDNRRIKVSPLTTWLDDKFNANTPWNKLVSELVTASGGQDQNGAVTFFLAGLTVDKMTDSVCSLFLGVQLQCAQCHNHPFTDWKQEEYWGMAQFFMRVRPNNNNNKQLKDGAMPGIEESSKGKPKNLPEAYKQVNAKFLGGAEPKLPASDPVRPVLAGWLTDSKNPFFAKAMVNRVWSQFFARGFVNPIDDMHDLNPASHPELLNELTAQFTASNFDLKQLVRGICNSQAYQRTSRPEGNNAKDKTLFSHMPLKVLTGEQLYDSLTEIVGLQKDDRQAGKAGKGVENTPRLRYVEFFNVADVPNPMEYEAGIPQALKLMNSAQLSQSPRLVSELARNGGTPSKVIETMYLMTLSRRPTDIESKRMMTFVAQNNATAYADILWALMNSSEFTINH